MEMESSLSTWLKPRLNIPSGSVVVITGASSGIGESLAYEFAIRNCKLVLAARQEKKLKVVAQHCLSLGAPNAIVVSTDVSVEQQCKNLIDKAISAFSRINYMILNAGVACHHAFEDTPTDVFKQLMQVNYFGYVYCTKYALPYLLSSNGVLAVVGSLSGELGLPGRTAYCASKFAVNGFFEALRTEVGRDIQITVVSPGFVKTNIRENSIGPKEDGLEHAGGEASRMSSVECARLIIDAIETKKDRQILTMSGRIGVALKYIAPKTVSWIASRKANVRSKL